MPCLLVRSEGVVSCPGGQPRTITGHTGAGGRGSPVHRATERGLSLLRSLSRSYRSCEHLPMLERNHAARWLAEAL